MSLTETDRCLEIVSARLDTAKAGLKSAHRLIGQAPATALDDLKIQRAGWAQVQSAGDDLIAAGAQLRRLGQRMLTISDDCIATLIGRAP